MDKKTQRLVLVAKIVLLVFLMVFSFLVASTKSTELPLYKNSVQTLDDSKSMVMKVTGATLGMSVLITFLPDDYATPLADSLADMNKYFILMLGMIFFEKLLLTMGVPVVFRFIIPVALIVLLAHLLTQKTIFKIIASKILTLALVLVLVVPLGTSISKYMCENYMSYVDETITVAEEGSELVEEYSDSSTPDKSFYEKVSGFFNSAIEGVKDLFNYYKTIIERFINSIVIMIVAYCVIPVLTFVLLLWILNQLFQFETFKDKGASFRHEIEKMISKRTIKIEDSEELEE